MKVLGIYIIRFSWYRQVLGSCVLQKKIPIVSIRCLALSIFACNSMLLRCLQLASSLAYFFSFFLPNQLSLSVPLDYCHPFLQGVQTSVSLLFYLESIVLKQESFNHQSEVNYSSPEAFVFFRAILKISSITVINNKGLNMPPCRTRLWVVKDFVFPFFVECNTYYQT